MYCAAHAWHPPASTCLVFKAHRLMYHSTLGSRVIKTKRSMPRRWQSLCSGHGLPLCQLLSRDWYHNPWESSSGLRISKRPIIDTELGILMRPRFRVWGSGRILPPHRPVRVSCGGESSIHGLHRLENAERQGSNTAPTSPSPLNLIPQPRDARQRGQLKRQRQLEEMDATG